MILDIAKKVFETEAKGILGLIKKLDYNFIDCLNAIISTKGKIVISGVGKSGIVAKKIAATFNSIGTQSIFLHPVDALHGDLGILSNKDVFIAISYSGETEELNILLPNIVDIGCNIIALTGNKKSILSKYSNTVLNVNINKEACPFGLVPTTSTTALMAMGDALSIAIINKKKFKPNDFRKNHPGGILGRRLANNVDNIMLTNNLPIIKYQSNLYNAIEKMNKRNLGVILIIDLKSRLKGIFTDGDLRRILIKKKYFFDLFINEVMTLKPHKVYLNAPVYNALNIMEKYQITVLPVIDNNKIIKGIIHLHDILGKGDFRFN